MRAAGQGDRQRLPTPSPALASWRHTGLNADSEARSSAAAPGVELAWSDGSYLPRAALSIPLGDAGFVMGATATEQLRTFRSELFRPTPHAARFRDSLTFIGVEPAWPVEQIFAAAQTMARHNHALLSPDDDLGVVIYATPGDIPAQHCGRPGTPRVAVHSFPLAFAAWARCYTRGVSLRRVGVQQVPEACWPLHLKCRSRMHYHLADREAHRLEPGARAILCHADGRVSETTTANVALVQGGGIVTPPTGDALAGVSLQELRTIAQSLGISWAERSLRSEDLVHADELLLTSTPNCLLPVTRLDGAAVGPGRPGPVYERLLHAWSAVVGFSIAAQAERFAAGGGVR